MHTLHDQWAAPPRGEFPYSIIELGKSIVFSMSRQPVWGVRVGLHELLLPESETLRSQAFSLKGSELHLLVRPRTELQDFDRLLRESMGGSGADRWFTRSASVGVGLLVGGAILMFLALIDLFNQLVGVLVSEQNIPSQWHLFLLVGTFVVGAAVVSFAPRLMDGDEGWVRGIITRWFDHDERTLGRIRKRVTSLQRHGVNHVVVWNAAEPTALGIGLLTRSFSGSQLRIELCVHGDELTLAQNLLGIHDAGAPQDVRGSSPEEGVRLGTETERAMLDAFGSEAAFALSAVVAASSFSAAADWRAALTQTDAFPFGTVSTALADTFFADLLAESGAIQRMSARGWFHRLAADYRVLTQGYIKGELRFTETPDAAFLSAVAVAGGKRSLAERDEGLSLPIDNEDVVLTFITMLRLPGSEWAGLDFERTVNDFVSLVERRANYYRGLRVLAHVIRDEIDRVPSERRLLPALRLPSLVMLQDTLGVAGELELAVRIARWLSPYTGRSGAIQRARLLEQRGRYDEALRECDALTTIAEPLVRQLDAGDVAAIDDEDLRFLNDYCRVHAWIRISAQRDAQLWSTGEARAHMVRLDTIAEAWRGQRDPGLTRERENYWALLHEWEGDRGTAIEHHRRAVELPAVPIHKVLGSTINLGRTMRDRAVETIAASPGASDEDWRNAQRDLREAEAVIREGYAGKLEIGDHNEAPIGAHNLVLAMLYLAATNRRFGEEVEDLILRAHETALHGLSLLVTTRSTRKWESLCEEAAVAARLAGLTWHAPATPPTSEGMSQTDREHIALIDTLMARAQAGSGRVAAS